MARYRRDRTIMRHKTKRSYARITGIRFRGPLSRLSLSAPPLTCTTILYRLSRLVNLFLA